MIQEAASDYSHDELSPQLSLPFDGEVTEVKKKDKKLKIIYSHIPFWEIIHNIEFLISYLECIIHDSGKELFLFDDIQILAKLDEKSFLIKAELQNRNEISDGEMLLLYDKQTEEITGKLFVEFADNRYLAGKMVIELNPTEIIDKNKYFLKKREPSYKTELFVLKNILNDLKEERYLSPALSSALGVKTGKYEVAIQDRKKFDESQNQAFEASISERIPLSIIQGPPGTGKSFILEKVIRHYHSQGKRILFTAPSNTAVDNICMKIKELPIVRLGSFEEMIHDDIKEFWINHPHVKRKYFTGKNHTKENVIFCGTHSAFIKERVIYNELDRKGFFDVVFFDEAGMTKVHELLTIAGFAEKAVLFGDQKQLPPFPPSEKIKLNLKQKYYPLSNKKLSLCEISSIEYLEEQLAYPILLLEKSYRCQNPRLLRFASLNFYRDRIKTSRQAEYHQLSYHEREEIYSADTLKIISTSQCPEEYRNERFSCNNNKPGIENRLEARLAVRVFKEYLDRYKFSEISIIAPYRKQISLIRHYFNQEKFLLMKKYQISKSQWEIIISNQISTVDSFQGNESDVIIISYTRSNTNEGIGFIENHNRINVAHTRCRKAMIIIADMECLKKFEKTGIFSKMERAVLRDGVYEYINKKELQEINSSYLNLFDT